MSHAEFLAEYAFFLSDRFKHDIHPSDAHSRKYVDDTTLQFITNDYVVQIVQKHFKDLNFCSKPLTCYDIRPKISFHFQRTRQRPAER